MLLATALFVSVWQQHGPAQEPAAKAADQQGDAQALSMHYRFSERYTDDPAKPDLLSQYQVASRDTVKVTTDKPQGAPEQNETVLHTIYTERVAKMAKEGQVSSMVRRYDKANFKTTVQIRPYKKKMLEGLTILYTLQRRPTPQVLCLTGGPLRDTEYLVISQQAFLPVVATILPRQPARVGDTWVVPHAAAWALLGSPPSDEDYSLMGEVLEVRKNPQGTSMTALLEVKGQCVVKQGPSGINAHIQFTFEPSVPQPAFPRGRSDVEAATKEQPSTKEAGPDKRAKGLIDAHGYVSRVSLAQEVVQVQPESNGRLKETVHRVLVIERRKLAQPEGTAAALEVPKPPPAPSVENSWLIYDDPQGKFHLNFPQELVVYKGVPGIGVALSDPRPDSGDMVQLELIPRSGDPERDRVEADWQQDRKKVEDGWKKKGQKYLPGPAGELPAADWSPLKRKVYRFEFALIPPDETEAPQKKRLYMDRYIVLFTRNETLKVTAWTFSDPHIEFRDRAEAIIKNFSFGPSENSLPAAPTPAPGPPSSPSR
jgi:hypothetical protein